MQRNSSRWARGLGGHVPSKLGLYYGQCMTSSLGRRGVGVAAIWSTSSLRPRGSVSSEAAGALVSAV